MELEDIIRYWLDQYNYRHTKDVFRSHRCCETLPYGGDEYVCRSPYCPAHCWRWEKAHYKNMLKGRSDDMYRLILPFGEIVPPPVFSKLWENFGRRVRRLYPDAEWYWCLELQGDNLHLHVLLKTTHEVTYQAISDKWRKTLVKQKKADGSTLTVATNAVSVKKLETEDDFKTVASYNLKQRWGSPWEYRPAHGLFRNLAFASRGFYDKEAVTVRPGHYHDAAHQYVADNFQLSV